jgi:hypothetical protein
MVRRFRHQWRINQISKQKIVTPSAAPLQILAPEPSQTTPAVESNARKNQNAEPTPNRTR